MRQVLPVKVKEALREKWPLGWEWFGGAGRTVMSGYALYAVTARHENGGVTRRRILLECDPEKAACILLLMKNELSAGSWYELRKLFLAVVEYRDFAVFQRCAQMLSGGI